jgi:peptidoglycan hydrolase-like protein with peptidoglycan-binding domain
VSEGPIADQRVRSPQDAPPVRTPSADPALLASAGNAAMGRMLQGAPSGAALGELGQFAGNAQVARLAGRPQAPGAAPAPAPGGTGSGAHGEGVADLQIKLSRLQASAGPLTEDGKYGPQTEAAVRNFQTSAGITPVTGIADPATKAQIDTAFAALPAPVRVVLNSGATGIDVGFAQQKLNAVGANPRLIVNAVFDTPMMAVVIAYELAALHRFPTGTVDAAMWAALDAGVKGGFVAAEGAGGTQVEQNTPSGTANSLGTQVAGTSLHPVTGVGGLTAGPAVHELQQKLNTAGASPALKDDGVFGPKTRTALQTFQSGRVPPLPATGTADKATWDALDVASPGSMTGSVDRQWTEVVGGATYSMVGTEGSHYSWEIQKARMLVTAKVNFVGPPPPGAWFGYVPATWNQYQGVDAASGRSLPIDFQMTSGGGGDSNKVKVLPGAGRANAGEWYLADTDAKNTIPHEFGHLIGLQDEYQLHPGDFVRVTGHEPAVGDATGTATAPATIATQLQTAMVARNAANAFAATVTAGVKPGAFAQRIVQEYAKLATTTVPAVPGVVGPPSVPGIPAFTLTGDLLFDLNAALPESSDRYETIQVLSYSSGSVMGDPSRVTDPHDHGAQPRHLGEFMAILGRALGGSWEAKRR